MQGAARRGYLASVGSAVANCLSRPVVTASCMIVLSAGQFASDLKPIAAVASPTDGGPAWAWGSNERGRIGDGTTTFRGFPVAVLMPAGVSFRQVSAGAAFSLALDSTGHAWAWGYNYGGELGDGASADSSVPVAVSMPPGVTFAQISAGGFGLALDTSGQAWAWGSNVYGQLGDGTTTDSSVPVAVVMPAGVTFTAVSAGFYFGLAIDSTGNAWAWGSNQSGQLGNGTATDSSVPVAVTMPAGVSFTAVSGAPDDSLALDAAGHAWAWGSNLAGQLGDGSNSDSSVPVAVSMPEWATFTAVSAGNKFDLALDSSGDAWAWGINAFGELGNGTFVNSSLPEAVSMPAGVHFKAVSAGSAFSLALDTVGGAWAWGTDDLGANVGTSPVPVAVVMPAGVRFGSLSAGNRSSLAIQYGPTSTTTRVASSAGPSLVGQEVTYTATVNPAPDGGTVSFADNGTTISGCAAQPVDAATGRASCAVAYGSVGSHNVVASYGGDGRFTASTSPSLAQAVSYGVVLLYDPAGKHKSGMRVPITLQLDDFSGRNLSSSSITVTALCVIPEPSGPPSVWTCGANPVANINTPFIFVPYGSLARSYVYLVSTRTYPTGRYELLFTANLDPVTHAAAFVIG